MKENQRRFPNWEGLCFVIKKKRKKLKRFVNTLSCVLLGQKWRASDDVSTVYQSSSGLARLENKETVDHTELVQEMLPLRPSAPE